MYEDVDTSSTVEIEQDPVVMFGMVLGSAAFVACGVWMVNDADQSVKTLIFGWAGIVFFGLCLVVIAAQGLRQRGPVLVVSPQGVTDRRARNARLLPWSDVSSVGEWRVRGQRMVVLGLRPAAWERLAGKKPVVTFLRKANAALGADGLLISASGLKASYSDIRNLITAFAKAHANLDPTPSSRLVRQS